MKKKTSGADARRADVQELEFLEHIACRLPDDTEIIRALADLYTKTGDYAEGLRMDERLSRLCPEESLVWYNLGCSYALLNRKDDAFDALGRAVELGYDDYEWMKKDEDLAALRGDPRLESMLEWIYNTFVQFPEK